MRKSLRVLSENVKNIELRLMNTKILICDDDAEMADLISRVLRKNHYDVDVITQMVGFMDKVKESDPDIILMDYKMPEINGVEAAKMLYADEDAAHIPVVFMSGHELIEKHAQQLNKLYIKKPFDIDKLRAILSAYAIS